MSKQDDSLAKLDALEFAVRFQRRIAGVEETPPPMPRLGSSPKWKVDEDVPYDLSPADAIIHTLTSIKGMFTKPTKADVTESGRYPVAHMRPWSLGVNVSPSILTSLEKQMATNSLGCAKAKALHERGCVNYWLDRDPRPRPCIHIRPIAADHRAAEFTCKWVDQSVTMMSLPIAELFDVFSMMPFAKAKRAAREALLRNTTVVSGKIFINQERPWGFEVGFSSDHEMRRRLRGRSFDLHVSGSEYYDPKPESFYPDDRVWCSLADLVFARRWKGK